MLTRISKAVLEKVGGSRMLFLALWVFVAGLPAVAVPETEPAGGPVAEETPIRITSDSVISNQQERWVEFVGHVRATQGEETVTAESLKIYYQQGQGESADAAGPRSVEKLVARGNVEIVFDKKTKTATADTAVYTAEDKILVLTGGTPTVVSGQDVIRGKKITVFQAENRTVVEGDQKDQVEATFYSQGEGGLIK